MEMTKYENKLNEIFTKKIMEFLNKGYSILNDDSGMGYFQRIDLYKGKNQLRIYIERKNLIEDNRRIEEYKLRVVEMKLNQSFMKDGDKVIFEKDFYIYK